MTTTEELDTTGLSCPLPVLKARKRLAGLPPGAVLRLVTTDPVAAIDVPDFCREAGHALLSTEEGEGGRRVFLIRKAQPTPSEA